MRLGVCPWGSAMPPARFGGFPKWRARSERLPGSAGATGPTNEQPGDAAGSRGWEEPELWDAPLNPTAKPSRSAPALTPGTPRGGRQLGKQHGGDFKAVIRSSCAN